MRRTRTHAVTLYLLVSLPSFHFSAQAATERRSLLRGATRASETNKIPAETKATGTNGRALKKIGHSFDPKSNQEEENDHGENIILASSLPPIHPMVGNGWVPIPASPVKTAAPAIKTNETPSPAPSLAQNISSSSNMSQNMTMWVVPPDFDIAAPEDISVQAENDFPDIDEDTNEDEETYQSSISSSSSASPPEAINVAPADIVSLQDEGKEPQILRPIHVEEGKNNNAASQINLSLTGAPSSTPTATPTLTIMPTADANKEYSVTLSPDVDLRPPLIIETESPIEVEPDSDGTVQDGNTDPADTLVPGTTEDVVVHGKLPPILFETTTTTKPPMAETLPPNSGNDTVDTPGKLPPVLYQTDPPLVDTAAPHSEADSIATATPGKVPPVLEQDPVGTIPPDSTNGDTTKTTPPDSTSAETSTPAPTLVPTTIPDTATMESWEDSPLWYKAIFFKKGQLLGTPAWYNTRVQVMLCQIAKACYNPPPNFAETLPTTTNLDEDPYWTNVVCDLLGICIRNNPEGGITITTAREIKTTTTSAADDTIAALESRLVETMTTATTSVQAVTTRPSMRPTTAPTRAFDAALLSPRGHGKPILCRFLFRC